MSRSWHKRRNDYGDGSDEKFSDRRRKKQDKQFVHNNIGGEEEDAQLYDKKPQERSNGRTLYVHR